MVDRPYRYAESGLDNVYLVNGFEIAKASGQQSPLHRPKSLAGRSTVKAQ